MNNKEKFILYSDLLKQWSEKMNLVAPSTLLDIENRHFADSAQLADFIPKNVRIIDLGSGAGFPGVVLAILGWDVTCVESIGKKARFLNEVKQQLKLDNLTVYNDRLEKLVPTLPKNAKDIVFTARAFASLIKILDYVGKCRYKLYLLKGKNVQEEIDEAKKKYNFNYSLTESKTGDGFILEIDEISR